MLDCIVHTPKTQPKGSIVWLHGLGASGDDFVPIMPHLQCPQFRFVFPHAPIRRVTLNGGMPMRAWYDIHYLEPGPDRENRAELRASANSVVELIQREQDLGISPDRIILAGFSQGSAVALHVAHRFNHTLLGVVALSGYVVEEDNFGVQGHVANSETPFFLAHGTDDLVVPLSRGRKAKELVSEHHSNTTWQTYKMGHEVCMPEIHAIRDWLHGLKST